MEIFDILFGILIDHSDIITAKVCIIITEAVAYYHPLRDKHIKADSDLDMRTGKGGSSVFRAQGPATAT